MDDAPPTSIESYDDAVRWIYGRINYERVRPRKSSGHFRLERVRQLLEIIDSPQERIPAVHIAGTKGKGSTAAILDSILTTSGIRSGLYTSPHIDLFEERMQVDGQKPTPEELTLLVRKLQQRLATSNSEIAPDGPTYFEVATMLAWMFFDSKQVDLVVLETGLGGRLDCTNVCSPVLTIITSIGLDHTHILGDTLPQIASEKAGILKRGVPVLTWVDQLEVIEVIGCRAAELDCRVLWRDKDISVTIKEPRLEWSQSIEVAVSGSLYAELQLPLLGRHQAGNAALAVAAADFLSQAHASITPRSIAEGVEQTVWPLRFEIVGDNPPIVLDAAHNPDSIAAFVATCREHFADRPLTLIFASSRDKDAAAMLKILVPNFAEIVLTQFEHNPRAVGTDRLQTMLNDDSTTDAVNSHIHMAETPVRALETARSLTPEHGIICCTGSIFIAAEVRAALTAESSDSLARNE